MAKIRSKEAVLCLAFCAFLSCLNHPTQKVEAEEKLNRSQTMLFNLKSAPESSGYYIIQSHRSSKKIVAGLEKALSQLAAVDQSYAKYRGRPDDRFLQAVSLKVTLARQTAQELEQQLLDAYAELKSSVEQALITDELFPSDDKKQKSKTNMPTKVKNFLL